MLTPSQSRLNDLFFWPWTKNWSLECPWHPLVAKKTKLYICKTMGATLTESFCIWHRTRGILVYIYILIAYIYIYTWIYIYIYTELNLGTAQYAWNPLISRSQSLPGRVDTAVSHAAVGDRSKLHIRHAAQQMEGRLPAFLARSTRSDRLNAGDEFCPSGDELFTGLV